MEDKSVVKKAFKGFLFTLLAQIIVLLLSIARSMILPKVLSVPDYGYWQIYVLYSSYVGIFSIGYSDGIYLKYGKYQYDELPFPRLRTATRYYMAVLAVFTVSSMMFCLLISDVNRQFSMFGVCIDIFLMGMNGLLIYILQITNQMKAYSFYSVIDKVVLLAAVIIISMAPDRVFSWVVMADVFSRVVVTLLLFIRFKDLFTGPGVPGKTGWIEFSDDIKIGINLMTANLMGMFVTGIGRFIVDLFGDITEYAYYSFGITITNLVMVFITAVSLVLYPTLKRLPESDYGEYFERLNIAVILFNFIALFAYFPAMIFIQFFLPQYFPISAYIHFLFGVIVLQAKMQMLINTFYKVLREEKALLKANLSCVVVFLFMAVSSFYYTKKVTAIAICTFIAMIYRCYASEFFVRRKMGLRISKDMLFEMTYIIVFVLVISFNDFVPALLIDIIMFAGYLVYSVPKYKKYGFRLKVR